MTLPGLKKMALQTSPLAGPTAFSYPLKMAVADFIDPLVVKFSSYSEIPTTSASTEEMNLAYFSAMALPSESGMDATEYVPSLKWLTLQCRKRICARSTCFVAHPAAMHATATAKIMFLMAVIIQYFSQARKKTTAEKKMPLAV